MKEIAARDNRSGSNVMKKPTQSDESLPSLRICSISAVTLTTRNMERAVRFYRSLGFKLQYGGETAPFTIIAAKWIIQIKVINL